MCRQKSYLRPHQPTDMSDEPTDEPGSDGSPIAEPSGSDAGGTGDSPGTGPARASPDADEVFCRNCGAVISEAAEICPDCGVRQRDPPQGAVDRLLDELTQGGNPFVAAGLSVLLPGLGQLYNRELRKGILVIVASLLAAASAIVAIGFVLYPAVWIYAIYDAYVVAERQSEEE